MGQSQCVIIHNSKVKRKC